MVMTQKAQDLLKTSVLGTLLFRQLGERESELNKYLSTLAERFVLENPSLDRQSKVFEQKLANYMQMKLQDIAQKVLKDD